MRANSPRFGLFASVVALCLLARMVGRISPRQETRSAFRARDARARQWVHDCCRNVVSGTTRARPSADAVRRTSEFCRRYGVRFSQVPLRPSDRFVGSDSLEALIHKGRRAEIATTIYRDQYQNDGEVIKNQKCAMHRGMPIEPVHMRIRCWRSAITARGVRQRSRSNSAGEIFNPNSSSIIRMS